MNLNPERYRWVIFSPGRKINDFGYAIAKVVGKSSPVILVEDLICAWRRPWKILLRSRRKNISGIPRGTSYKIWHTPERFPILSAIPRKINVRRLVQEINRLIPSENRLVVYDRPSQYKLPGELGERLSIYLVVDDLTLTVAGESLKDELEAEKRLLEKVSIVICVSENLAQRIRKRLPLNSESFIHVLPNGYDPQIFDPQKKWQEPDTLQNIPHPRILIAGYISERIDWEGIKGASQLCPQWIWIFIGPADSGMKEKIRLYVGNRGFWHPPVTYTHIPGWIKHSDACAVPYRLNSFTLASHPLKAMEYLAMGKPALCTRVPSLKCYDGVTEWVEEGAGESYARALDRILRQNGNLEMETMRMRAVANDSWDARVDQFRKIVLEGLNSADKSKFGLDPKGGS